MAPRDFSSDEVAEFRYEQTDGVLSDHEERITQNERFRLRMQGAMGIIGFSLGGGAVTTLILFAVGIV